MSQNYKYILLFIYVATVILSVFLTYNAHDVFPLWFILLTAILAALIVGTGYVRHLIEPLERRSNELELLSRQTLHELNLPVATILANTQMLLKKEDDPKNIKRIQRIDQAASVLKTLYGELDYMIKKQIHKVELQECDLKELIDERLKDYKELFAQINFESDLESSSVKVDTIGFVKVLDNLVNNAVKYSKPDSVVQITLKDMQLSIEDEGVGMEEDFLLKAFEHYFQEDQDNKGQGLGLGLVKEYCDRNRIKIYVNSKKGLGTKISLDFNSRRIDAVE